MTGECEESEEKKLKCDSQDEKEIENKKERKIKRRIDWYWMGGISREGAGDQQIRRRRRNSDHINCHFPFLCCGVL